MSIIDEQNDAFIQSAELDLMKEISRIDEACKLAELSADLKKHVNEAKEVKEIKVEEVIKPTLEELRKLRTHFFNNRNMM